MLVKTGAEPTYAIFVRFRKSRLPLRRGLPTLEVARVVAEGLRKERFHGQDAIFVVREPDGAVIDLEADAREVAAPRGARLSPRLPACVERSRRAAARAHAAAERFERSYAALAAAIASGGVPAKLVAHHERAGGARDLVARALSSFKAATARTAEHLQRAGVAESV